MRPSMHSKACTTQVQNRTDLLSGTVWSGHTLQEYNMWHWIQLILKERINNIPQVSIQPRLIDTVTTRDSDIPLKGHLNFQEDGNCQRVQILRIPVDKAAFPIPLSKSPWMKSKVQTRSDLWK